MLDGSSPSKQRRKEKRLAEPRVASTSGRPGGEVDGGRRATPASIARPDGRVALGVRVEDQPRPVRGRHGAGNEVRDGDRVVRDERLVLRGERGLELGVGRAVDEHAQAPLVDPRPDVDRRRRAARTRAPGTRSGTPRRGRTPGGSCRAAGAPRASTRARPSRRVARHPGSAVRSPSHTIAFPSGSSQWYASCTPSRPRERHGAVPAFSSRTRARVATPARCSAARTRASEPRAAPRERGARRLAPWPRRTLGRQCRSVARDRARRRPRLARASRRPRDASARTARRTSRRPARPDRRRRTSGRCATSPPRSRAARRSGSSAATARARRRCCGSIAGDHQADGRTHSHGGPHRLAPRARRRVPSRLHGPRERLPERRDPGAPPRGHQAPLRRDRRVRRARERDRPAGPHVLVGDDDAARLRDRRVPRRGHPPPRRGLRRRRRGVPAQVLRPHLRLQGAGRDDRLRVARRLGRRAPVRALRVPRRRPGRVRRSDARGCRPLPARARRRRESGRARRRSA